MDGVANGAPDVELNSCQAGALELTTLGRFKNDKRIVVPVPVPI